MQKHEKLAADFLAVDRGWDITFIEPDRARGSKTPDILMNNLKWEIKSPKGKSSRTIENNLRAALLQSPNIILDLRRLDKRIPAERHEKDAEHRYRDAKSMKRLYIITRNENLICLE